MVNDYVWTRLYAQRQQDLRARAHRRGGDPASAGTHLGLVGRLRLRLGRHAAATRPAPMPSADPSSPVTPAAAVTAAAAARDSASAAPTTAAVAWARLASGAGDLEPATSPRTESERDAA